MNIHLLPRFYKGQQYTQPELVCGKLLYQLYEPWENDLEEQAKTMVLKNYRLQHADMNSAYGFLFRSRRFCSDMGDTSMSVLHLNHQELDLPMANLLEQEAELQREIHQVHGYLSRIYTLAGSDAERNHLLPKTVRKHVSFTGDDSQTQAMSMEEHDRFIKENQQYADLIMNRMTRNLLRS